jgi:hypothetical protein
LALGRSLGVRIVLSRGSRKYRLGGWEFFRYLPFVHEFSNFPSLIDGNPNVLRVKI